VSRTLNSLSETDLSSKSNLEWLVTGHFSGMSTSEEVSSDLESETMILLKKNSGGSSTQEPELSDHRVEETSLFQALRVESTKMETLLSSENGKDSTTSRSSSTPVKLGTSEISERDALKLQEITMLTIGGLAGGTAVII
jgi:hypothetical protein